MTQIKRGFFPQAVRLSNDHLTTYNWTVHYLPSLYSPSDQSLHRSYPAFTVKE